MELICQTKNHLPLVESENKIESDSDDITNYTKIQNEIENLKNTTNPKEISRIKKRIFYWKNRKKLIDRVKTWDDSNRQLKRESRKSWYIKNKERCLSRQKSWREQNREKDLLRQQNYKKKNKEKLKNYKNPNFNSKIARLLRSRLKSALKNNRKVGSAVRDLGCSIEFFKNYLESKFVNEMSWENHGTHGWHIDHIKPLSSFDLTNRNQLLEACHYTNLQPLWGVDNRRKGGIRFVK
jgi:hypothetical protein